MRCLRGTIVFNSGCVAKEVPPSGLMLVIQDGCRSKNSEKNMVSTPPHVKNVNSLIFNILQVKRDFSGGVSNKKREKG